MLFNFFGTLNSILIVASLVGVFSQVRTVWLRKRDNLNGATEVLSLNKFFVSFLAYYSFFVYGMSIEPFNHFIVWPRLIAALLVAVILYEIWVDRKAITPLSFLILAIVLLVSGVVFGLTGNTYEDNGRQLMTVMIVIITIFLAQGYIHQIMQVLKLGSTGALDIKMSQFGHQKWFKFGQLSPILHLRLNTETAGPTPILHLRNRSLFVFNFGTFQDTKN